MRQRWFRYATTGSSDLWVADDCSPWRRAKVRLATLATLASLADSATGGRQSLEESR